MRNTLRLVLFGSLAYFASSCGKGRKKGDGDNKSKGDVIHRMVGTDVETSPYDASGDSPVSRCNDLNCNFDSLCCWSNNQPPADQLNWIKASGQGQPEKMQYSFGTQQQPDGSYLVTAAETSDGSERTAQLYSCSACSQGSTTVRLRHWQSRGMTIRVCHLHDPGEQPQKCQTLPANSGSVDSVQLPQDPSARVAIVARGFTEPSGSVAMIDDISVECDPCEDTTTPPPPTEAPTVSTQAAPTEPPSQSPSPSPSPSATSNPPCKEVVCNFEAGNLCSYSVGPASGTSSSYKNWAAVKAQYENRLTGIPKSGEGQGFGACYLNKGEKATLKTSANFDKEYVVLFNYYEATQGLNLKVCCGNESNCPYGDTPNVQISDYKAWKTSSIKCPAGTNGILFIGEDLEGRSEGAVGVDNIQLMKSSGSSDQPSENACQS